MQNLKALLIPPESESEFSQAAKLICCILEFEKHQVMQVLLHVVYFTLYNNFGGYCLQSQSMNEKTEAGKLPARRRGP